MELSWKCGGAVQLSSFIRVLRDPAGNLIQENIQSASLCEVGSGVGWGSRVGDGHTKRPCTCVHCCLAMPEAGTTPRGLLEKDQFVL